MKQFLLSTKGHGSQEATNASTCFFTFSNKVFCICSNSYSLLLSWRRTRFLAWGDSGFCIPSPWKLSKTLFHRSFFIPLIIDNETPQQGRTFPREEEEEAVAGKWDVRNSRRGQDSLRNLEAPGKITIYETWKHQRQLNVEAAQMAWTLWELKSRFCSSLALTWVRALYTSASSARKWSNNTSLTLRKDWGGYVCTVPHRMPDGQLGLLCVVCPSM